MSVNKYRPAGPAVLQSCTIDEAASVGPAVQEALDSTSRASRNDEKKQKLQKLQNALTFQVSRRGRGRVTRGVTYLVPPCIQS